MNLTIFTKTSPDAMAARNAAQRRSHHTAQFNTFLWGVAMAFTGLLLAVAYCLLTHQIRI
jgi:type VI protein secretion system component VasF